MSQPCEMAAGGAFSSASYADSSKGLGAFTAKRSDRPQAHAPDVLLLHVVEGWSG